MSSLSKQRFFQGGVLLRKYLSYSFESLFFPVPGLSGGKLLGVRGMERGSFVGSTMREGQDTRSSQTTTSPRTSAVSCKKRLNLSFLLV